MTEKNVESTTQINSLRTSDESSELRRLYSVSRLSFCLFTASSSWVACLLLLDLPDSWWRGVLLGALFWPCVLPVAYVAGLVAATNLRKALLQDELAELRKLKSRRIEEENARLRVRLQEVEKELRSR